MKFFLFISKSECVALSDFEHHTERVDGALKQVFSMTAKRGIEIEQQCTVIERRGDELTGRDCLPRSANEKDDGAFYVTGIVLSQYPIRDEDVRLIDEAMNRASM
jgi:hypothetical protein